MLLWMISWAAWCTKYFVFTQDPGKNRTKCLMFTSRIMLTAHVNTKYFVQWTPGDVVHDNRIVTTSQHNKRNRKN